MPATPTVYGASCVHMPCLARRAMLLTTFSVNYTGRPFMAALSANKGLMFTLVGAALLVVLLTSGSLPELSDHLELLPLPELPNGLPSNYSESAKSGGAGEGGGEATSVGSELLNLMFLDFVLCLGIEKGAARLFRY